MAILNQATQIGDITDVYNRLSSIKSEKIKTYKCVSGDNRDRLNSWLSELDNSINSVIIDSNGNNDVTFSSTIELPDTITMIDFNGLTISNYNFSTSGIIKSLATNIDMNITIKNLHIKGIQNSSINNCVFSFNYTSDNGGRMDVKFVNCSFRGNGVSLVRSNSATSFISIELYNVSISYSGSSINSFQLFNGNYKDSSTYHIYNSYIDSQSSKTIFPQLYSTKFIISNSYIRSGQSSISCNAADSNIIYNSYIYGPTILVYANGVNQGILSVINSSIINDLNNVCVKFNSIGSHSAIISNTILITSLDSPIEGATGNVATLGNIEGIYNSSIDYSLPEELFLLSLS